MTAHDRPSPRLALYGLAFRTLRALAVHAPGRGATQSRPAAAGAAHGLAQIVPVKAGAEPLPGAAPGQEA